jgi:hypothetical protein
MLETVEMERLDIARQLIDFGTKFSHMLSGKIGSEGPSKPGRCTLMVLASNDLLDSCGTSQRALQS